MRPLNGYISDHHSQYSRLSEILLTHQHRSLLRRLISSGSLPPTPLSSIWSRLFKVLAVTMRLSWTCVLALAPIAIALVTPVPDTGVVFPIVDPVFPPDPVYVQSKCPKDFPDVCTTNCTVIQELPSSPPNFSFQTQCKSTCVSLQFDKYNCGCCGKVVSTSSGFPTSLRHLSLRAWVEFFVADFGHSLVRRRQDPRGLLQIWRLLLIFCQMAPTTPRLRRRPVQNTRGPGDIIHFCSSRLCRRTKRVMEEGFTWVMEQRKGNTRLWVICKNSSVIKSSLHNHMK